MEGVREGEGGQGESHTHHDEIDDRDGIEFDPPEVHDSHQVDGDHDNGEGADESREEIATQEQEGDDEDGCGTDGEVDGSVSVYGQVLLVEHIEYTGKTTTED